jgi:toluene monooxygenase system protein E
MTAQRTYWHLERLRRVPSDYEIASSRLLYYPGRGFSVRTPVASWYERYQSGSDFSVSEWEEFFDPLNTTYEGYVVRQANRESFVDGLFRSIEGSAHDAKLAPEWIRVLDAALPVLRYPYHALQMVAAYVAQLAPTGRLAILGAFQVGDQMRLIQRFAYRMCQLRDVHPEFGATSKEAWVRHPVWQPLRKTSEQLLVSYDFGEAFVALNLVLKPVLDAAFLSGLAKAGEHYGDAVLPKMLFSFQEDAQWHLEWSNALANHVRRRSENGARAVVHWVDTWRPRVARALAALLELEPACEPLNTGIADALGKLDQMAARLCPQDDGRV